VLTWEAKKEAIFEMPVGIRCERETRKIGARAGRALLNDSTVDALARVFDVRVFDTDD
jgi:hypothetical protein